CNPHTTVTLIRRRLCSTVTASERSTLSRGLWDSLAERAVWRDRRVAGGNRRWPAWWVARMTSLRCQGWGVLVTGWGSECTTAAMAEHVRAEHPELTEAQKAHLARFPWRPLADAFGAEART